MSLLESSHRCHQLLDRFHFQGFLDSIWRLERRNWDKKRQKTFDFTAGPSLSEVVPIHWNPPQRCVLIKNCWELFILKLHLGVTHSQQSFGFLWEVTSTVTHCDAWNLLRPSTFVAAAGPVALLLLPVLPLASERGKGTEMHSQEAEKNIEKKTLQKTNEGCSKFFHVENVIFAKKITFAKL